MYTTNIVGSMRN